MNGGSWRGTEWIFSLPGGQWPFPILSPLHYQPRNLKEAFKCKRLNKPGTWYILYTQFCFYIGECFWPKSSYREALTRCGSICFHNRPTCKLFSSFKMIFPLNFGSQLIFSSIFLLLNSEWDWWCLYVNCGSAVTFLLHIYTQSTSNHALRWALKSMCVSCEDEELWRPLPCCQPSITPELKWYNVLLCLSSQIKW